MGGELDYQRFGRQIALPELGPDGQRRLEATPVRFAPPGNVRPRRPVEMLAATLHEKAGGRCMQPGDPARAPVELALPTGLERDSALLGVAAFCAVEAARRVLEQPAVEIPDALLERLGASTARSPK